MPTIGTRRAAWGLALGAACTVMLLLVGCGGTGAQKRQAQALGNVSVLSATAPLPSRLVTGSEVAAASDQAAEKTFLHLWSLLQFQAWDQGVKLFQPGLRAAVGNALLSQALSASVLLWQSSKPVIRAAELQNGSAVIRFYTRLESGQVVPTSISFERGREGWLVSYFPLMDFLLERAAQQRAQASIEPLATKASPGAVRQGAAAALLQSAYREKLLKESAAARRSDQGITGP